MSLRWCFAYVAVTAAAAALLIVRIELPEIRRKPADKLAQFTHVDE